jgi:hypothetical protein
MKVNRKFYNHILYYGEIDVINEAARLKWNIQGNLKVKREYIHTGNSIRPEQ